MTNDYLPADHARAQDEADRVAAEHAERAEKEHEREVEVKPYLARDDAKSK